MRIYLTHCSAEKNQALKESGDPATPDTLYTDSGIQQFMTRCQEQGVPWAILSDLYGIFRSDDRQAWYEKHPDTVTKHEEALIIQDFERSLNHYDEIWFYVRSKSFHPFYGRVLKQTILANKVVRFVDLDAIESKN